MGKILSIELNESDIKVCVINSKGKKSVILKSFTMEVSRGTFAANEIFEVDTLGFELRKMLKKHKISIKDCIMTINSTQIYGRNTSIPKQNSESKALALLKAKIASDNIFPIGLENNVISYKNIGTEMVTIEDEEVVDETNNKKVTRNKKVKKVEMQNVLVYMLPESMVKSVVELAQYAKLHLLNIEYSGNAVCQYVSTTESSESYVIVHVNDTNVILSAIVNKKIYYQRHADYGYKKVVAPMLEQSELFSVSTTDEALQLITETNFLDKEQCNILDKLNDSLIPVNEIDVGLVQGRIIDEVISLFDSVNSFVNQCRATGNNPSKIILVNERENFTDIVESLEYTTSLGVEVFEMSNHIKSVSNNKFLVPYSSVFDPINFNIAENAKVKRDRAVRRLIVFEGFVAVWVCVLYTGVSYIKYETTKAKNKDYIKKIEQAGTAQNTYRDYMLSMITNEQVLEFKELSNSVLNDLDNIINAIEDAMPRNKVKIEALAGDTHQISFTVSCDSKNSAIKFIQELEKIEYFYDIQYSAVAESESFDFESGRSVTVSLVCTLEPSEEEEDSYNNAPSEGNSDEHSVIIVNPNNPAGNN